MKKALSYPVSPNAAAFISLLPPPVATLKKQEEIGGVHARNIPEGLTADFDPIPGQSPVRTISFSHTQIGKWDEHQGRLARIAASTFIVPAVVRSVLYVKHSQFIDPI